MMTLGQSMRISSTGLTAERFRMDVISSNIANAHSMSTGGKEAYRRRNVELAGSQDGVRIERIVEDRSPLRRVYEPSHPMADGEGFVTYSNVDPIREMVDMMSAGRAYEANLAAFNAAKTMARAALNIGKT